MNEVGNIVSSDDYNPWGMILNGRSTNVAYNNAKNKFTGKERDNETGYDYFGARYFDSRIGRWLVVDPLFEKYPGISPYNYSLNNPVTYFDTDGRFVWGPGALAAAGVLEAIGWATIVTGVTITAIGPENTGRGVIEAGEWVQKQSSNLINLIPDLSIKPTPFPITQGEGINQNTIAPSDVLKIPIVFETGGSIPVKLTGGEKGVVQVHINPEAGNVHIQPLGKGQTHHQGVIINPSKPLTGQIKDLVKGPASAIQKVEQQVKKALEQLKEIKGE